MIKEITIKSRVFTSRKNIAKAEAKLRLAQIEAEDEALMAYFESDDEVEVLLDEVEHTEKPQAKEAGRITKALPKNRVKVSIPQFASFIERGCSFKASVLTSTTKDSFVSSNIVALDVDNKESYTTIDEFIKLTGEAQLKPFMLYETFSSTDDHQRFRVLYRFNRTITDSEEMEKLYNYVWSLFPTVDLDYSVDHSKILYGGKKVVFHNNSINEVPDLSNVSIIKKTTVKAAPKQSPATHDKHITPEEIKANLEALRPLYEGQVMNAKDINENIKLTDLLNVSLGERFRCILPSHDDEHPSSRIIEDKNNPDEQVYICTCDASGYRLVNLWARLFNLSYSGAINDISKILGISNNTEYQKKASDFANLLIYNFEEAVDDEIKKYLDYHALRATYFLLLEMVRNKAIRPVSKNPNDIAIYVSNSEIAAEMKKRGIKGFGDVNRKMNHLCNIGIIRNLTRDEIDESTLNKRVDYKNNTDYYSILDLTYERMSFIKGQIARNKKVGYRCSGTNAQREINALGYEYVRNNSRTQSYNKRKDNNVLTAVKTIVKSGAKYFSEEDVNRAIRNKNHRINKKQAEKLILDFLNGLVEPLGLERTRVNKKTRKAHKIDSSYVSNSVIYIVPDNCKEIIDFI